MQAGEAAKCLGRVKPERPKQYFPSDGNLLRSTDGMVHMVVQMRENEVKKIANCPSRPLLTCSPVQFKQAMHPEKEEQEGTLESLAAHCIIYIDRVSTGI
eukprot:scaffold229456_cov16-Tisochrysis_lutea.AAC.3